MEIDLGGLSSLIFLIGLLAVLLWMKGKRPKDVKEILPKDVTYASVIVFLLGTAFLSLWLAVRVLGLFFSHFLEEKYSYQQYQILEILSYILIANLCFTLYRSLKHMSMSSNKQETHVKFIVEITLQAVLIGAIVFLPKSSDLGYLSQIKDLIPSIFGFFLVSASLALVVIALTYLRSHVKDDQLSAQT